MKLTNDVIHSAAIQVFIHFIFCIWNKTRRKKRTAHKHHCTTYTYLFTWVMIHTTDWTFWHLKYCYVELCPPLIAFIAIIFTNVVHFRVKFSFSRANSRFFLFNKSNILQLLFWMGTFTINWFVFIVQIFESVVHWNGNFVLFCSVLFSFGLQSHWQIFVFW